MNDRESLKRHAITVDMPGQLLQRIARAAKIAGQSKAEWMRRAAAAHLQKLSRTEAA